MVKRMGYLFEHIVNFDNLLIAARKALRGKKDRTSVGRFYFNLENELLDIRDELLNRSYRPGPIREFTIYEPKKRKIGASDIRDRVVHHAICNIIGPVFEKRFISQSYACRRGKGTHRAIARAQRYCRKYRYYLKMDIKKFFQSIDHSILKRILRGIFRDPDLLWLLEIIIDTPYDSLLDRGIPIGSLTSQNFANLYLDRLDHFVKDEFGVKGYLRYMDDFILFANDKATLHELRSTITNYLHHELRLEVNCRATSLAPVSQGLPFLGFRIFPDLIRIKKENKVRTIRKMEQRIKEYDNGEITQEGYLQSIMSMTEHFKTGNTYRLRRDIYNEMFLRGKGR